MWQQEFLWFFTIFHHEFRKNNPIAFEVLMVLAVAHLFGFYNPKQLADFLEVPHQQFYTELKDWTHGSPKFGGKSQIALSSGHA
jgi:hypothetical protein